MKEVKHYICEICATEYKEKQKCQQCEKSHCKVLEIVKAKYISFNNNVKGYPVSIAVKMSDGTEQIYKRG